MIAIFIRKKALKRNLHRNYYNIKTRNKLFNELDLVNKEINKVKFKIRFEREKNK